MRAAGTALVTGASSGIGEALARRFAQLGFDLVLVARGVERLQALAQALRTEQGVRVHVHACDLSVPDAPRALAAALRRARCRVDVLVNNAGVVGWGEFARQTAEQHRAVVELNVGATTQMLAQFLPPMLRRGAGRVLNVASVAAFQPLPRLAAYAASKAYLLALSEALAEELRGSGVTVTTLCPGITATPMLRGAQRGSRGLQRLPPIVIGEADAVAAEGVAACLDGALVCIPGTLNQAAVLAARATPRVLLRRLGSAIVRRFE